MALKAGYKGIKKYIADKLNALGDVDNLATDAEVSEAVDGVTDLMEDTIGWLVTDLFTKKGSTSGHQLRSDGTIYESASWSYSDYIPIKSNRQTSLTLSNTGNNPSIVFYNADKEYISGIAYANRKTFFFVTPDNTAYCRVSYLTASEGGVLKYFTVNETLDTKTDNSIIGNVESASGSTHAYTVGQYFICDGELRVAIGDGISVSDPITNSNSTVITIAAVLKSLQDQIDAL